MSDRHHHLVRVVRQDELWPGEMLAVTIRNIPIVLVNIEGHVHAYRDRCAHLGVRVSEGTFEQGMITCRAHRWQYDGRTGEGRNPQGVGLLPFPVSVVDGVVYVDISGVHHHGRT